VWFAAVHGGADEPAMRSLASRRFVVIAVVLLVALVAGSAAVVQLQTDVASRHWHRIAQRLQAECDAQPVQRGVLWGEPRDGDAWQHYDAATALAQKLLATDEKAMLQMLRDTDEVIATSRDVMRARWRPVVDALRAGAQATRAMPPPLFDAEGKPGPFANLLTQRWVANAAVFEARALRHAGRGSEAVRHTLDACTFAFDQLQRGLLIDQMIGAAILTIASSEAWPDAAIAGLDRDALDLFAGGLERLDHLLPQSLALHRELVHVSHYLQQPVAGAELPDFTAWHAWRHGFSHRWMLADAFTRVAASAARMAEANVRPWPERQGLFALELQDLLATGNPALQLMVPNYTAAELNLRQVVAGVRMLRMAVDRHRGLDVPPLRDPLGDGPIVVERDDTGVQLRCAGASARPTLARRVAR
jgi:hypothetical protein